MGAPKGGGYTQKETLSAPQQTLLNQLLQLSGQNFDNTEALSKNPLYQQAVQGTQQFLPGGGGFAPIQAEAQRQYKQETIPSILNAYGSGAKSSSALNQALAASGANLNSSLAAQLAQMQLQASNQAAGLAQLPFQQGLAGTQAGLGVSPFAYMQRSTPFWQDALLASISGGSKIASSFVGR